MAYTTKTVSSGYYSLNPVYGSESNSTLSVASTAPEKMKIKEILKKWFDEEIGEGFRFEYNEVEFVVEKSRIRSVEKFNRYDYGDGDYDDLFEWIDTENLDEEVKITQYVWTIHLNEDSFGYSHIYDNNNTLPYGWFRSKEVRCCPVCSGRGFVSGGFYSSTGNTWVTSTTTPDECRTCGGKGYVEV